MFLAHVIDQAKCPVGRAGSPHANFFDFEGAFLSNAPIDRD